MNSFYEKCIHKGLHILILDEDPDDAQWLQSTISQVGIVPNPVFADEEHALQYLNDNSVDAIVVHVKFMRFVNHEFAKALRKSLENKPTPVLFITNHKHINAIDERFSFVHHDFIVKPFLSDEFVMRLQRVLRQGMGEVLRSPIDNIIKETQHACQFYTDLINEIREHQTGISIWTKKLGAFSGDIAVQRESPGGTGGFILFADAMGHGLCAALSLIPMVHEFEHLVNQGNTLESLCETLNESLYNRLPDGVFVAAILAYIDYEAKSMTVWNGGMPNIILYDQEDNVLKNIESLNLPMGITTDIPLCYERLDWKLNDSIFLASDGCVEAMNKDGIPFGYFDRFFEKYHSQHVLDIIAEQLEVHISESQPHDDMTLLQITPSKLKVA